MKGSFVVTAIRLLVRLDWSEKLESNCWSHTATSATAVPSGPYTQQASSSLTQANSRQPLEKKLWNMDRGDEEDCGYWIMSSRQARRRSHWSTNFWIRLLVSGVQTLQRCCTKSELGAVATNQAKRSIHFGDAF